MTDFVAYPSRGKIALLLLGGLVFVGLGLWMAGLFGAPPESHRWSPEMVRLIGWVAVVFFGLCTVGWGRRLFDKQEQVRIGPAGIRARPWSDQTIPWPEIVEVTTWTFKRQTSIILHLRDRTLFPGRGFAALLAGANRGMTGGDVAISLTGTDRKTEEALAAIERFRSDAETA
jgi:hypothetical protein